MREMSHKELELMEALKEKHVKEAITRINNGFSELSMGMRELLRVDPKKGAVSEIVTSFKTLLDKIVEEGTK